MIPSNLAGVLIFALLIACAASGMHWRVRRVVKFRYVVLVMVLLVIVTIISGK